MLYSLFSYIEIYSLRHRVYQIYLKTYTRLDFLSNYAYVKKSVLASINQDFS